MLNFQRDLKKVNEICDDYRTSVIIHDDGFTVYHSTYRNFSVPPYDLYKEPHLFFKTEQEVSEYLYEMIVKKRENKNL